jgi:pimeloyl-ACP methyl ester carboxylesterase
VQTQGYTGCIRVQLPHTDGLTLHARRWGDTDLRFVFIHGLGEGGFVWNHVIPGILSQGSAVAIDLRGHGDSDWDPAQAYAMQSHAVDVSASLRTLCMKPVILVGHSLGAAVVLQVAAMERAGISGVVLVDGGPQLSSEADAYVRQEFSNQPWWYRTPGEYARFLQERFPLAEARLLEALAPHALREEPAGGYRLKCDQALVNGCDWGDEETRWSLFKSIRCPLLLIRGSGSAVLPRSTAARMTHENTRCLLKTVPFAGHAVMLDNPSGFLGVLGSYLATLS